MWEAGTNGKIPRHGEPAMPSAQAHTPDLKQVQSLQTAWKVVLGYYTTRQSHIQEPHSQPKTVGNQRSPESGCIKESKTVQGAKN
uniref:Uncharacterized protein n=1 Tax=Anguilla anguilla TaxID=7936 RepID=A0A0E9QZB5_ANGAN